MSALPRSLWTWAALAMTLPLWWALVPFAVVSVAAMRYGFAPTLVVLFVVTAILAEAICLAAGGPLGCSIRLYGG